MPDLDQPITQIIHGLIAYTVAKETGAAVDEALASTCEAIDEYIGKDVIALNVFNMVKRSVAIMEEKLAEETKDLEKLNHGSETS